jgi:hypothetical protein
MIWGRWRLGGEAGGSGAVLAGDAELLQERRAGLQCGDENGKARAGALHWEAVAAWPTLSGSSVQMLS